MCRASAHTHLPSWSRACRRAHEADVLAGWWPWPEQAGCRPAWLLCPCCRAQYSPAATREKAARAMCAARWSSSMRSRAISWGGGEAKFFNSHGPCLAQPQIARIGLLTTIWARAGPRKPRFFFLVVNTIPFKLFLPVSCRQCIRQSLFGGRRSCAAPPGVDGSGFTVF